ncbi:response regulator transcription factor [Planosporangium thailandense]|uniref:Response regulator transcription factor n=1 Tax=Planosporangium thailandense TaxID=765197 RepID=A0ABX0Y6V5_9ACTN|nr:response regulator transcription factor [Planosporangium thailandense]
MLTATGYELLRFRLGSPKSPLCNAQILERVYNYDFGGQANVIDLYISYLRMQVDDGREPMIHINAKAGHVAAPTHGPPTRGWTCDTGNIGFKKVTKEMKENAHVYAE